MCDHEPKQTSGINLNTKAMNRTAGNRNGGDTKTGRVTPAGKALLDSHQCVKEIILDNNFWLVFQKKCHSVWRTVRKPSTNN